MTVTVIVMIIIGIIICIASFFVSEKLTNKNDELHKNLMTLDEDYEFSERELRIIRRKIEDVIANQAKDILYETNESLSNMANEKTMALGDYAVAVCEQIDKNHKEVMFLYSMLDDKQKEIMKTVRIVNDANKEAKDMLESIKNYDAQRMDNSMQSYKQSALDQLTAMSKKRQEDEWKEALQQTPVTAEIYDGTEAATEDIQQVESELEEATMSSHLDEDVEASMNTLDVSTMEEDVMQMDDMEDVFAELDQTDVDFDDVLEEEFKENENSNDIILEMHRNGSSIIEIAKQLGLGVGEVKLVIDLYKGA